MLCASDDDCPLVKPNIEVHYTLCIRADAPLTPSGGNTPTFKLQLPQEDDSLRFAYNLRPWSATMICYRFIKQLSDSDCLLS